jgi:glycogen operon protein
MLPGAPSSLGVSLHEDGINVAVVSRHAERVLVSLFDQEETHRLVLPFRLGDVHYGFIEGVKASQRYGLRAEGLYDPRHGHLFDPAKLLIDPYAGKLDRAFAWHPDLAAFGKETAHLVPKGIVSAPEPVASPLPPKQPGFIYEIAVKAFTMRHPVIPEKLRGTVAALAHPVILEHLTGLGVDTVELMPLAAWIDERHLPPLGLSNAWGYNPISFFAPDPRLAPGGFAEIRGTVAALHDAGIRVVLDVVFNHTGESDLEGPTLSLRGLDHALYYRMTDGVLANDTGCGNTLALDRAPVTQLVMDAMRHWVKATGIDGFRYDLATVMGRRSGSFDADSPLLTAIQQDPLLSPLVHIAEPWDIGPKGYRLGQFPAHWHEWNDRYRDDVRRFWRGDRNAAGALATRITGSSDVFAAAYRPPSRSINYVAAHDGFTLADAVTHVRKNNLANGEGNRDGSDHEVSWQADEPERDIRAMLATLVLSRGTPMLTAGDEFGRSQGGNNNAYAQDNATTWLDWENADDALIAFVAVLVRFKREFASYFADRFLTGKPSPGTHVPDAQWFAATGELMTAQTWADPDLSVFGLVLGGGPAAGRLALSFNRLADKASLQLPPPQSGFSWSLTGTKVAIPGDSFVLPARSVTVFLETAVPARRRHAPDDETLNRLAVLAGIQPEWWEVDGTYHRVSIETKRALLAAMSLPVDSTSDAQAAIAAFETQRALPLARVVAEDSETVLILGDQFAAPALTFRLSSGEVIVKPPGSTSLPVPRLPAGAYDLVREDDPAFRYQLIVSPGQCFLPGAIGQGRRLFGLASHLYALRHAEDAGIGDFETLARFGETSARLGGALAGINPLHHLFPDDRERASPYQPSDRRFIDPIYVNIDAAVEEFGLPKPSKAEVARLCECRYIDYPAVWRLKERVLHRAFNAFENTGGAAAFDAFIAAGGAALATHAAFESRNKPETARYHMWLQWLCDRQLAMAAERGRKAGLALGLYRDLALGCAYDGGEVWARPDLFASSVSLGAPPDPFARDGQIWNLPPFNPHALAKARFEPFSDILRANMRHASVLRIDHILGFARQFWVPRGASGADGAYVAAPTDALIALTAIESQRARCLVIGEDLGTVPEGLRHKLAAANILSYRVLWFEQDSDRFHPPEAYPRLAAACLSSHDLKPFQGWRETGDAAELRRLERALAEAGLGSGDLMTDAHAFLARTPSALMLVQADDLAGETEPLNVPGTDKERPNWRRRLSVDIDELAKSPAARQVCAAVRRERAG